MLSLNRTSASPWIVLVEDDESLRGQLARALERALPEIEVQRTPDADLALRLVRDSRSRLLITETQTASVDGVALAACARRQRPQLPLIFLADMPSVSPARAALGLHDSHLIGKPPALEQFVGLVTRVLEAPVTRVLERPRGFRGELSTSGAFELVQLAVMTTPTGALRLQGHEGSGTIWFESGAIVHAAIDGEPCSDALQRMLRWRSGTFAVDAAARAPDRTLTESTMELLLDAARACDEESVGGADEREPGSAAEHFESGLQAVWRKDYAQALPDWERAVALEPENRLYQHNLMRLRRLIQPRP